MTYFYGTFDGNSQYRLVIETWLISQNIPANTSLVGWRVFVEKTSGSGYSTGNSNCTWNVGGGIVHPGGNWGPYNFASSSTHPLGSGTQTVGHAADGSWSMPVFATATDPNNFGTATISSSFPLPTIPRATTPTVSPNPVDAGSATTIDLSSRASASFTHDISYSFGSLTNQTSGLSASSGVGTSATFTPPLALLNEIPNAVSGVCVVKVVTKNGATVVGEKTVNLTIQAGAAIAPDFTTVTHAEATTSPNVASIVGGYVQSKSTLAVAITGAAGAYGSTITAHKIEVKDGGDLLQSLAGVSGTTAPIPRNGTISLVGTVTDSRGRTKSKTVTVTVLGYAVPQVTDIQVRRSNAGGTVDNSAGTYIRVDLTAAVQSLIVGSQKNTLYYKIFTSPAGAGTWTQRGSEVNVGALTYGSSFVVSAGAPYSVSSSFDVRVEVRDALSTITQVVRSIATGAVLLDLNGSLGVGVGKYHENGVLDVAGDIYMGGYKVVDLSRLASASQVGLVELATSAETITGTDTERAVTPAGLATLTASDTRKGLVERATTVEAQALSDAERFVTPEAMGSAWPSCLLRRSANYSLTTTSTALTWDVELHDPYAMHHPSTNTARLVAPVAGLYEINFQGYNNNTSGTGVVLGRLNGSTAIPGSFSRRDGTGTAGCPLWTTFSVVLAAGDYVEIMVYHSTAAGTITGGTDQGSAQVSMRRIG